MDTQLNKSDVYPSIDELLPSLLLTRVPATLARDIEERYRTLGEKYLTEERTTDGRRVNACMHKSSTQDAIEEVIDAAFNVLVWLFKLSHDNSESGYQSGQNAMSALSGLIEIYSLLSTERSKEHAGYKG